MSSLTFKWPCLHRLFWLVIRHIDDISIWHCDQADQNALVLSEGWTVGDNRPRFVSQMKRGGLMWA